MGGNASWSYEQKEKKGHVPTSVSFTKLMGSIVPSSVVIIIIIIASQSYEGIMPPRASSRSYQCRGECI